MTLISASTAQQQPQKGEYTSSFLKWYGHVQKIPILKAIMNANADAVTASWETYGPNQKAAAKMLDGFRGKGKESFKLIVNNMIKIAKIGGDAYAEILLDANDDPEDLVILPPDNIKQIIEKGRIVRYEEVEGSAKPWKPEEIFHLAYNPIGSMTHGTSVIEPMNNLLIDIQQVWEDMSKLYHRYVKPINLLFVDTDDDAKLADIASKWKDASKQADADIVLPKDTVEVRSTSIPQFSILDPANFHRILIDQIIMGSRVPELALGTGSVNSEESARMQFMGFRQMVRWDQKFLEENVRNQIFNIKFPEKTPRIRFSFAAEGQEERFDRVMKAFGIVNGSELNEEIKGLLLVKLLEDGGVVEK